LKVARVITKRDHGGLNYVCENGFEEELTDLGDITGLKSGSEEDAGVACDTLVSGPSK